MTLTVTIDLIKLLGLADVDGVEIDICETVNGTVDIILTGDPDKVTALAKSLSEIS